MSHSVPLSLTSDNTWTIILVFIGIKLLIHGLGKNIYVPRSVNGRLTLWVILVLLFIIFASAITWYQWYFQGKTCQTQTTDAIVILFVIQFATLLIWTLFVVVFRPFGQLQFLEGLEGNE